MKIPTRLRTRISGKLPSSVGVLGAQTLIDLIDAIDHSPEENIELDATRTRFVEPLGLCLLACAGKRWVNSGRKVEFVGLDDNLRRYLERMDVLDHCGVEERPTVLRADGSARLVEVTRISKTSDIDSVALKLAKATVGEVPNIEPDRDIEGMRIESEFDNLTYGISHVLSELMDNSLSHGRRAGYTQAEVWVCCQYFPKRDTLRLAVVDDGCGLLNSLRSHPKVREKQTHEHAILTAFQPGVSCNKEVGLEGVESSNLGMGLTICHALTRAAGGNMWVGSGDTFARNPDGGADHYVRSTAGWQGLIAVSELARASLRGVKVARIVNAYRPADAAPPLRFA